MAHRHNWKSAGHDGEGSGDKWAMCTSCDAVKKNKDIVAEGLENTYALRNHPDSDLYWGQPSGTIDDVDTSKY